MCKLRDDTMSQAGELPIEMIMKKPKHMPHPRLAMDAALTAAARAVLEYTKAAAIHLPISEGMSVYLGADVEIAKMLAPDQSSAAVRGKAVAMTGTHEKIVGAVARGWCAPKNTTKIMDSDLVHAIVDEVEKLFVSPRAADAPSEPSELRAALIAVREALQHANDSHNGGIVDTLWMLNGPETVFDFIDTALESRAADALDSQPTARPTAKQLIAQLHDGQTWTVAEQNAFAEVLACFPNESSQGIISLGDAWKHGQAYGMKQAISRASAAPAASVDGWQPIETAPTVKGECFFCMLAWGPDGDQSVGEGMRWNGRWFATGTFYAMGKERKYEFREIEVKPTHWMRGPAAPQQEGSEAGNG